MTNIKEIVWLKERFQSTSYFLLKGVMEFMSIDRQKYTVVPLL
jgi:hypothetical protein